MSIKTLTEYLIEEGLVQNNNVQALISRTDMPQIDDQMLRDLDEAFGMSSMTMNSEELSKLKSLQPHIDMNKVNKINEFRKPIIVSSDSFIVDGNHRAAAFVVKKNGTDEEMYVNIIGTDAIGILSFLRGSKNEKTG